MAGDQVEEVDDGVGNLLVHNSFFVGDVLRQKAQEGGEVGGRCGVALLAAQSVFDRIQDNGSLLHALQLGLRSDLVQSLVERHLSVGGHTGVYWRAGSLDRSLASPRLVVDIFLKVDLIDTMVLLT